MSHKNLRIRVEDLPKEVSSAAIAKLFVYWHAFLNTKGEERFGQFLINRIDKSIIFPELFYEVDNEKAFAIGGQLIEMRIHNVDYINQ